MVHPMATSGQCLAYPASLLQGAWDGNIYNDASRRGSGAYICTRLENSCLVQALPARVPGASPDTVRSYAERGIALMTALPAKIAGPSSTPRKPLSIIRFVRAIHHLLRGLCCLLSFAYLVWVFTDPGRGGAQICCRQHAMG